MYSRSDTADCSVGSRQEYKGRLHSPSLEMEAAFSLF